MRRSVVAWIGVDPAFAPGAPRNVAGPARIASDMAFMMSTLLVHSEQVPPAAREALLAANAAPPSDRGPLLASAARILHHDADLDCADALELVGLPADCGCGG